MARQLPQAKLSAQHVANLRESIAVNKHLCDTFTGPGCEAGLPLQKAHEEALRQIKVANAMLHLCGHEPCDLSGGAT